VPEGRRVQIPSGPSSHASLLVRGQDERWEPIGEPLSAAVGAIVEVRVPFDILGVQPGQPVAFFVTVHDAAGVEIERHPAAQPIQFVAPDESYEARLWSA
jgi:hypothetical protein